MGLRIAIKDKPTLLNTAWLDRFLAIGVLLFLVLLPFHLVIKTWLPDPLGTYWKEALLSGLFVLWLARCILARCAPFKRTLLNLFLAAYLGVILLQAALGGFSPRVLWGAYTSILYLPLVWLAPAMLEQNPRRFKMLLILLAGVGTAAALGGVLEFVFNRAFFPSVELAARQGFADVFIYATHIRRVYFTFDSPTALANTLALLLPAGLALTWMAERRLERIIFGLAALLMAVCILVTFSRGIWVAVAVSLTFMMLASGLLKKYWRGFALAALLLVGLVLGLGFALNRSAQVPAAGARLAELTPLDFHVLLVGEVGSALQAESSTSGEIRTQQWKLLDPISLKDDVRGVMFAHPPESGAYSIHYRVQAPENGGLSFAIALSPEVWGAGKGDGVNFRIYGSRVGGAEEPELLFTRYINPKQNPSDRRWRNYVLDLSPWAGSAIDLGLITDPGPSGDWAFDWAGWADLKLVTLPEGFFTAHPASQPNVFIGYLSTIQDWSGDETNRDRLAAWNLGLQAWKESPLWGKGLGSTGVAALRVQPQTALVTESQFLKALVEMGILGFCLWVFLWVVIARMSIRALRAAQTLPAKWIAAGVATSLMIVFIDGLVYQNLEVKQVNALFWVFVGILAYLQPPEKRRA